MASLHLNECDTCRVFHVNTPCPLAVKPAPADPLHDHSEITDPWCCQACADADPYYSVAR